MQADESLTSAPRRGVGAHIQFLINNRDKVQVVFEEENCWVLVTGRIAKKAKIVCMTSQT
jgi:archaellum component FlaG (FlaF/FlaG flagellin family)